MVKMVRLEKTASDRRAEKDALGEPGIASVVPDGDSGISIHLDHHHLEKMGIGGDLKSGGKVELIIASARMSSAVITPSFGTSIQKTVRSNDVYALM